MRTTPAFSSRTLLLALAAATIVACEGNEQKETSEKVETPEVEFFNTGTVMGTEFPFSEAVRVGDLLILSGQIGVSPGTTTLVAGGMQTEAKQTMDNIKAVLAAHGRTMADVVKCTVMLADMSEWPQFNDIYKTYFTPPYPARSALGASGLAFNARTEVECIATARESGDKEDPEKN